MFIKQVLTRGLFGRVPSKWPYLGSIKLSPSSVGAVIECSGYLTIKSKIPFTEEAKLGIKIHKDEENKIKNEDFSSDYGKALLSFDFDTFEAERKLNVYVNDKVSMVGVIDFIGINHEKKKIWIIDLKTGNNIPTTTCPQMLSYGYMVRQYGFTDYEIHLGIYDYKNKHLKKTKLKLDRLKEFEDNINSNEVKIPAFTIGEHCYHCFSYNNCPAAISSWGKFLDLNDKTLNELKEDELKRLRSNIDRAGAIRWQIDQILNKDEIAETGRMF